MNKIILFFIAIVLFSCKDEKKTNTSTVSPKEKLAFKKVILPRYNLWSLNRVSLKKSDSIQDKLNSFKLERLSTEETAYAMINSIPVTFGEKYRLSVVVKKGLIGNLFGLRVVGEYPNRIDVVFDLKNGVVSGNESSGDFIKGEANISPLKSGWYKCSIITEFDADNVKIILGPTSGLRKATAWEAKTNDYCDNYIITSSLTLEEISN